MVVPAAASNWTLSLKTGSTTEAQARTGPTAPYQHIGLYVSSSEQEVTVSWQHGCARRPTPLQVDDDLDGHVLVHRHRCDHHVVDERHLAGRQLLLQGGGLRRHQVGERRIGRHR